MSLAEAKRVEFLASFPFPASAHDIYYAACADWVSYEALIRFDASRQDCEAVTQKILEWSQPSKTEKRAYETAALEQEVSLPEPVFDQWLPNVNWWSGPTVKRGYFADDEQWGTRQLWIDSDLGRVYYHQVQ